jgi:Uma2 family endonuclease
LRRWEEHPEIKLAELIGGIVYTPSPVSVEHGEIDGDVGGWLFVYRVATPGTASGLNTTSFLLEDCPQPDVYLRILAECGGKSSVEGKYLHGAPELFAETSRSSASYDLHQKLELYQTAGVQEYLTVLLFEREIRWHVLVDGVYQVMPADADGVWRSRVFPGLWLDGQALLAGNMKQVLAKLNEGIASREHQDFVDHLAANKK